MQAWRCDGSRWGEAGEDLVSRAIPWDRKREPRTRVRGFFLSVVGMKSVSLHNARTLIQETDLTTSWQHTLVTSIQLARETYDNQLIHTAAFR